ncbi:MAG: ATP-binding cassette domain-containing protein [Calditrichaeota bacterium]|nr:MAG: ATP-binding cassette domain-containing protein [Calditrichota bacterium]
MQSNKKKSENSPLLLKVDSISKDYNGVTAVDELSFTVEPGHVFALLGPNGAGKTSVMRMIMDIIRPDKGAIFLNDEPRQRLKRKHFGYLPEERGLYPHARVLDMLIYFGVLNGMARRTAEIEAIRFLDRFGLVDYSDHPLHYLSKGMQQKVQFIAALLHKPDVLILDEPFTGLDPINQIALREILEEYKKEGKLILLSTHQMEMAEKMCDRICMIHAGKKVIDAPLSEIKEKFNDHTYLVRADHAMETLHNTDGVEVLEAGSDGVKFRLNRAERIPEILKLLSAKHPVKLFQMLEPSLHDIFIHLIRDESEAKHV